MLYIRDVESANRELAKHRSGAFGFDLEWKPNFAKGEDNPTALIQLASKDMILLIHVSAMSVFPAGLREFLVNPNTVKAGVAIQRECAFSDVFLCID